MKPIDNKYSKWYNELVQSRQLKNIESYSERHHIIPRSLGGQDNNNNIVKLTAREHFVAHLLLTKMYTGTAKHKMSFAFGMMLADNRQRKSRYKPTSRLYEMARNLVGAAVSNSNKGKTPWNKGIPRSQEVKDAVSKANKGRTAWNKDLERSIEDRQKMKSGWDKKKQEGFVPHNKGKVELLIVCEHCKKSVGGKGNYRRWHGDNCKIKE